MRHRQSLSPRLATLARQQAGVLTTAQLLDGGLTHRVIHRMAQEWQQPCRGVYLTSEPSWETAAWAGILRAGDAAVVTGHAAAYLHKLIPDPPQSIVIAGAKQLAPLLIGGRLVSFRRISRAGMGSPSRALVEAAIVDMARDGGEDDVVAALACALAENKTTAAGAPRATHPRAADPHGGGPRRWALPRRRARRRTRRPTVPQQPGPGCDA